jgi:hypothetical protein
MADEGVESGWNAARSIWLGPIEALDSDPGSGHSIGIDVGGPGRALTPATT